MDGVIDVETIEWLYCVRCVKFIALWSAIDLTLSRLGTPLVRLLSLAIHISPNNGPINTVSNAKPISHVLPIHCAL